MAGDTILLKGGEIVAGARKEAGDILVREGRIESVHPGLPVAEGAEVIDLAGKTVVPAFADIHVHFREPGFTAKETIRTGSMAAARGGYTAVCAMPNLDPVPDSLETLAVEQAAIDRDAIISVLPYCSITKGRKGLELVDFKALKQHCIAFSDDGSGVQDEAMMRRAMEAAAREDVIIAAHCEDEELIQHNTELYAEMVERDIVEPKAPLHPKVRTEMACYLSSSKAVDLAAKTDAKLHILHVSTAKELELFRNDIPLKDKKITAETCPHYLRFCDDDYRKMKFSIKCNPAIKSEKNKAALMEALQIGLIDTIASDHAPHRRNEKYTGNYFTSKSGFASIQHSLEVMLEWVLDGMLTFPQVVQWLCHNPAILYQIDRRGFIREGYHADLALVDLNDRHVISTANEFTKCHWTPYKRMWIRSRVSHTFVNGNLVYENGEFHDESRGERLVFNR